MSKSCDDISGIEYIKRYNGLGVLCRFGFEITRSLIPVKYTFDIYDVYKSSVSKFIKNYNNNISCELTSGRYYDTFIICAFTENDDFIVFHSGLNNIFGQIKLPLDIADIIFEELANSLLS